MSDMILNSVINAIICTVLTILSSVISAVLIPALSDWLTSKAQSEKLKNVITDVTTTVQTSVEMLEQTLVAQLKKDGEWDSTSQMQVLRTAVTEVIENLTTSTRSALEKESIDLESLVTRYIESYIQSKKSN